MKISPDVLKLYAQIVFEKDMLLPREPAARESWYQEQILSAVQSPGRYLMGVKAVCISHGNCPECGSPLNKRLAHPGTESVEIWECSLLGCGYYLQF